MSKLGKLKTTASQSQDLIQHSWSGGNSTVQSVINDTVSNMKLELDATKDDFQALALRLTTVDFDIKINQRKNIPNVKREGQKIANKITEKYPLITIDEKVLGEPRLDGTRFAVSNVLTALTLYDSFDEVIDEYENRYSKEQLKDAVKFARDFLDSFYRP